MMCTTVLLGGVCHRTSTPHKSGNTMKEKKKETPAIVVENILGRTHTACEVSQHMQNNSSSKNIQIGLHVQYKIANRVINIIIRTV